MDSIIHLRARLSFGAVLCLFLTSPVAADGWQPDPAFGLNSAGEFAVLSLGKPTAETDGQSKLDLSAAAI